MAESPDQNREVQYNETTPVLAEEPPHVLLSQALYYLHYYTENSTDLGPVEAVQRAWVILIPITGTGKI